MEILWAMWDNLLYVILTYFGLYRKTVLNVHNRPRRNQPYWQFSMFVLMAIGKLVFLTLGFVQIGFAWFSEQCKRALLWHLIFAEKKNSLWRWLIIPLNVLIQVIIWFMTALNLGLLLTLVFVDKYRIKYFNFKLPLPDRWSWQNELPFLLPESWNLGSGNTLWIKQIHCFICSCKEELCYI